MSDALYNYRALSGASKPVTSAGVRPFTVSAAIYGASFLRLDAARRLVP